MPPSLKTLALELELSVSTVARALRGDDAISTATRSRVAAAAATAGYRPSRLARALVSGRTQLIGLHLYHLQSFYVGMALRLERLVAADGYASIVTTGEVPPAFWRTDGDICLGHLTPAQEEAFRQGPLVSIAEHPRADFVAVDLAAPTAQAVRLLAATGARSIAHLGPGVSSFNHDRALIAGEPRQRAFQSTMQELDLRPQWIDASAGTRAAGRLAMQRWLASGQRLDGLVCHNDEIAIGAYRALRDGGIAVPQDCAVVGCDGIDDLEYLDCPLTSIAQPLDEYANALWAVLRARIDQPRLPQQRRYLCATLKQRASTRTP